MKKWTIIIQINAESNLIFDSIGVIDEISQEGSTEHINYIVLFDGMENPRYPKASPHPSVYRIEAGKNYEQAEPARIFEKEFDELAEPKTLKKILLWIKQEFPAENYAFIYKGHGGAGGTDVAHGKIFTTKLMEMPVGTEEEIEAKLSEMGGTELLYEGYSPYDKEKKIILAIYSNKEEGDYLTYKGLAAVLSRVFTKKELALVCLDCCWGQQIEHAYTFRNVTEYFVASVDEMTSKGLGYQELCRHFNKRPTILPYELANMMVAVNFVRNYADYDSEVLEFREMGVSLTCVNTARLEKHLDLFNAICKRLTTRMKTQSDTITKSLKCCKDYTYKTERSLYAVYNLDLIWFFENIMFFNSTDPKLNEMILKFISHHILYYIRGYMGNNYKDVEPGVPELGGRGVSIAFPRNKEELENSIYFTSEKPDFVKDSNWKKMLLAYYKTLPEEESAPPPASRAMRDISLQAAPPVIDRRGIVQEKWNEFYPAQHRKIL